MWIIPRNPAATATARVTSKQTVQKGGSWELDHGLKDQDLEERKPYHEKDMESEKDGESGSPTDLVQLKDELKQRTPKPSDSRMRNFSKGRPGQCSGIGPLKTNKLRTRQQST